MNRSKPPLRRAAILAGLTGLVCLTVAGCEGLEEETEAVTSALHRCGQLAPGETMGPGLGQLSSCNGVYKLVFGNGRINLQGPRGTIFTLSDYSYLARLVMQHDGNLVLYWTPEYSGRAIYGTGTHGNPGAYLAVQDDGNLVIYSPSGRPLWTSDTHGGVRRTWATGGRRIR
jgi:hypothetical protein